MSFGFYAKKRSISSGKGNARVTRVVSLIFSGLTRRISALMRGVLLPLLRRSCLNELRLNGLIMTLENLKRRQMVES